jgi:ribosomal protein S18 acetylase RimI-like enzyme
MIEIIEANLSLPDQAADLVRLLNEYAQHPMGGGEALSQYVQDNLAKELHQRVSGASPQESRTHVIFAKVDGIAAGLLICIEGFSTFACRPLLNIHDVMVSQPYRGQGLSKKLLLKAEEIATKSGCCKITLEVLEGNQIAQAAYRSAGFNDYQLDPTHGRALFWQKKL